MILLSAVIITYNEEANIGRCLDSLREVADEIIVMDAWSTDKTVDIAKSHGAIVKQGYFLGYIQQKNSAVSFASNNYILSLDADEALDETLIQSILSVKRNFNADAYSMNRCTNYCGKFIRNGTWYPDKKIRLFNRRMARWGGTNPHEKIELTKAARVMHLPGDILHYSFPNIESHLEKNNRYSTMAAQSMYARGKKSSWFKILVNPCWAFFHGYLLRLGFLDGYLGFSVAVNTAHGTYLKYIKLHHLQHHRPIVEKTYATTITTIPAADQLKKVANDR